MSGGSKQAEGPHDKQCPHCGLFYQDKGVSFQMHTASCEGSADTSEQQSTSDTTPEQPQPTETDEDTAQPNPSSDPTMGSGKKPDTSDVRELPCGCYEIDISEYPAGNYQCDDCGHKFRLV